MPANLADILMPQLPMEKTHQRLGIKNPFLKMMTDPFMLGSLAAGGAGLGAVLGRKAIRGGSRAAGQKVAKGMLWGPRPPLFPGTKPARELHEQLQGVAARRMKQGADPEEIWRTVSNRRNIDPTSSVMDVTAGRKKLGKMNVLHASDTPIYDWDLGPAEAMTRGTPKGQMAHPFMDSSESVENLAEVLELARQRASRLESKGIPSNLSLYLTPGGYRGIEQGVHAAPEAGLRGIFDPGSVDPGYKIFSQKPGGIFESVSAGPVWMAYEGGPRLRETQIAPSYRARVSPKPGRDPSQDWIAGRVGAVGGGAPLESARPTIFRGHDQPIVQQGLRAGTPQMQSFLNAVSMELPNLKSGDANTLVRNLARRYGIPISAIPAALAAGGISPGEGPTA